MFINVYLYTHIYFLPFKRNSFACFQETAENESATPAPRPNGSKNLLLGKHH